jgi:hypothetical protein
MKAMTSVQGGAEGEKAYLGKRAGNAAFLRFVCSGASREAGALHENRLNGGGGKTDEGGKLTLNNGSNLEQVSVKTVSARGGKTDFA